MESLNNGLASKALHSGLAVGLVAIFNLNVLAQFPGAFPGSDRNSDVKMGVVANKAGALDGYTLVFPLSSKKTYLIDLEGHVVHKWESKYLAGQEAYLLENGHLLRGAKLADGEAYFAGAAAGGRVQEFTWDGEAVASAAKAGRQGYGGYHLAFIHGVTPVAFCGGGYRENVAATFP